MREAARRRIADTLPEDARVLDVGGWAVPFPRADWVLDLGAYETRGQWGYDGERAQERFTAETWVRRDMCAREPWPFGDGHFDFAVCSHTLEDLRDPVWVCSELTRVARAGYIEVPSRLEEQAHGFQGPWTGWSHHHWLIDVDPAAASIDFVFKHHVVHAPRNCFATGFFETIPDEDRVSTLWWEGAFDFRERLFETPVELDAYLRDFVLAHGPPADAPDSLRSRTAARRRRARRAR